MPLKTLLLNPPSFENFDGGASSRWPATREIESYWYPVWLAYPAGMLEGSKLLDAPPHHVSAEQTIEIARDYEFLVLFTSTVGWAGIHQQEYVEDHYQPACERDAESADRPQGQVMSVALNGSYTSFAQGATTANFGPGVSVGGAAVGAAGPVTVNSATSATAQLVIASGATIATNPVTVASGTQVLTSSFGITAATAQNIDLAITKSHTGSFTQGQNGAYTIGVSNNGPGATSGTVTVTDTLPAGLSVVSMSGSGWSCTGTTCTTSNVLGSGSAYPLISLTVAVATNAATSVTNSVTVSGDGTDNNLANNTAVDPTTIVQVPASITATAGTPQSPTIRPGRYYILGG